MAKRRPKAKGSTQRPPYRVFVSHATADKWIARVICEKIESISGVVAFRDDRDIRGGENIPAVLRNEIQNADELLVLLTVTSITRPWVFMEIGMAFMIDKRIVPICYNVPIDSISMLAPMKGYTLDDLDKYVSDLSIRVKERDG